MKTFLCLFLQTGVIFSIAVNEKIDSVVDQFNAKSVIDLVAEQYVFNDHDSVVFNDPDSAVFNDHNSAVFNDHNSAVFNDHTSLNDEERNIS